MADTGSVQTQLAGQPEGQVGTSVALSNERLNSLRNVGFTESQVHAILSVAAGDGDSSSLSSADLQGIDQATLNALQYTGLISEVATQYLYLQAPVSLLNQVSNPSNWQGDTYVGPGASTVNSYTLGEPVDFSKPSLDALVMSVLTARAEIIEEQLREQISAIQEKNAQLEDANDKLAEAKGSKADAGTSGESPFTDEMKQFWDSLDATYQDGRNHNSADWDVNIEGLKSKIEGLTSQSQLETTKLQQTINKYNQAFEMLSNFINKYYQSLSTIIQNLR